MNLMCPVREEVHYWPDGRLRAWTVYYDKPPRPQPLRFPLHQLTIADPMKIGRNPEAPEPTGAEE